MIGRASACRTGSLFIFKHSSPQFLNSHLLLMATRVFQNEVAISPSRVYGLFPLIFP
jgi:hypothetical protein